MIWGGAGERIWVEEASCRVKKKASWGLSGTQWVSRAPEAALCKTSSLALGLLFIRDKLSTVG